MRQCPTHEAEGRPLITHQIGACQCLQRQRESYHKCHSCAYRGKPAAWTPEPLADPPPIVDIPRNGVGHHMQEATPLSRLRLADAKRARPGDMSSISKPER